jgi:hypothetical protein
MAAWVGLLGVVAGALIAFGGQYVMRRVESRERFNTLLLEQFALIIALSEDFRNRVWEERKQVASDVVGKWDLEAYRLAEARLRVLSQSRDLKAALEDLDEAGAGLGDLWRHGPRDDETINNALRVHRDAIERFVALSSQVLRRQATL